MNGTRRFYLFHLLLFLSIHSVSTLCNMPSAWRGSWYQRGMSSLLEITIDHIQTKGRCLDALPVPQYYLFADHINRCTRCLLFIERHVNLLQYRESECSDMDDPFNVSSCPNMIAPDAALYTLHRNNSQAQPCPIQAPYRLTQLIKDGSECPQTKSSSYIAECANDQQFHLHLDTCSSYQQILDLQFVCVGTWTEGFHTYFVTRILPESRKQDNQYACFHFQSKQKDVTPSFRLSMATDDSCRDLNSKYMATIMTLSSMSQQLDSQLNSSCLFPEEFHQIEWYSLNRSLRMIVTHHDIDLVNLQRTGHHQRLHCLQINAPSSYRIRSLSNCDVTEQCLRIFRRTPDVVEIFFSDCEHERSHLSLTFLRKSSASSSCPTSIGHLSFESTSNQHQRRISYEMSVGCEQRQRLTISQKRDTSPSSLIQTDNCVASWQSDDAKTIYLIAQSIYSNSSYCLNFQMNERIIIRNHSQTCSLHSVSSHAIYSGKWMHPCSRSSPPPSSTFALWITMLLFLSYPRR